MRCIYMYTRTYKHAHIYFRVRLWGLSARGVNKKYKFVKYSAAVSIFMKRSPQLSFFNDSERGRFQGWQSGARGGIFNFFFAPPRPE